MSDETVRSLADLVGGTVHGDGSVSIRGVADLRTGGPDQIGFVRSKGYEEFVAGSGIGAVIVAAPMPVERPQVIVGDVQGAFARIARLFHPHERASQHSIHPSAVVDPTAVLEAPVAIGPLAAVGARSRIGAGSTIYPGVVIGDDVELGEACVLKPRVVIRDRVRLGARVIVQAGAVIGEDGFGNVFEGGRWEKVPQLGDVCIEDDVEIGANCTIDRGTLGSTRIGRGTKMDNLVHVGHNCRFGEHCAIAALSAFSGSTVLGDRVTVAGHVVTGGHQRIGDDVRIGGNSGVLGDIPGPGDYMGFPIMQKRRWIRTLAAINKLADRSRERQDD